MNDVPSNIADVVRTVFLVPHDFAASANPLSELAASLPTGLRTISTSFIENLHGVSRTLSIPFQYTYSQIHGLHWQRVHMAERIRARGIMNEEEREPAALASAKEKFDAYMLGEGREKVADDVLDRLLWLKNDPESLAAARELTRQGIVLTLSAIEVLARDAFVYLLNNKPAYAELLLADPANRKRFSAERVEWQTLAAYGYNLSSSLGSYFISKADLKSVPAIRGAYGALFPAADELQKLLGDRRLWNLSHKRNLIVHKRGIVDLQYQDATGDNLAIGDDLWVAPREVEDLLETTLKVGTEVVRQVAYASQIK
ncbi:MAG: hypothetical protein Q7U25_02630 [Sulfuricella sp.]|jgi:hypothetical protein|nr:hypothetical protein [Sulfuricella sp.]